MACLITAGYETVYSASVNHMVTGRAENSKQHRAPTVYYMWAAQMSMEHQLQLIFRSVSIHLHIIPHSLPPSLTLTSFFYGLSYSIHTQAAVQSDTSVLTVDSTLISGNKYFLGLCFPQIERRHDRFRIEKLLSQAKNMSLIEGVEGLASVVVFWGKMKILLIMITMSVYYGFLFMLRLTCVSIIMLYGK